MIIFFFSKLFFTFERSQPLFCIHGLFPFCKRLTKEVKNVVTFKHNKVTKECFNILELSNFAFLSFSQEMLFVSPIWETIEYWIPWNCKASEKLVAFWYLNLCLSQAEYEGIF